MTTTLLPPPPPPTMASVHGRTAPLWNVTVLYRLYQRSIDQKRTLPLRPSPTPTSRTESTRRLERASR